MPRPLRIEIAGASYHVINRSKGRKNIFVGKGAAEAFVQTLGETATQFGWRVHAFVVMKNHFHLAVELSEPNLGEGMKWLQGTWIRRYLGSRGLTGRPFQGRYKSLLLEPGATLGLVCHHIHLNPVRAGAVSAGKLLSYSSSSLPLWLSKDAPAWLESSSVLGAVGGFANTPTGWKKYLEHLEFLATDAAKKKEMIAAHLSRGWCVGTREFKKKMRKEAAQLGAKWKRSQTTGRKPVVGLAERAVTWEKQLLRLAKAAKINLNTLPKKKSHEDKMLLAAALKQSTSVSNRWVSERLQMGVPASASQFARRWQLEAAGRKATEQLLVKVKA